MKADRVGKQSAVAKRAGTVPGSITVEPAQLARWRRWGFRLLALLLPLAGLGLLEGGLRLLGYGYPTGFFREVKAGGQTVLVENERFGRRYFPAALVRTPPPLILPLRKEEGAYRVFVFGESAAMGDPAPAYGFGRILEILLEAQYPRQRFEVVNVAVTAINSHVVRQIARDCAVRQGDLWVVYMGNNEVVGPFGAGTVFGPQTPSLALIRAPIALKATRVGQLLDEIRQRFQAGPKTPSSWGGMEMFLDHQVRQDDPQLQVVYGHFRRNLEDILQLGREAGVRVLVGSVASNLGDCPPFASAHRPDLTPDQLARWRAVVEAGAKEEGAGNQAGAVAHFAEAARLDGTYAELYYRLGRCYGQLGRTDQARLSFVRARDLDTLRFRADSEINRIISEVAAERESEGITYLDLAEVCAGSAPRGIPGEEIFYDHVHFNFRGNYLIARTLAERLAGLLPARIVQSVTNRPPLLSLQECARQLALTDWDRYRVWEEVDKRLREPPFTRQLDREKREAAWRLRLAELKAALDMASPEEAIGIYESVLAERPEDWNVLENFAILLQRLGRPQAAETVWRRLIELLPHRPEAYYSLGNSLDSRGQSAESVVFFQQALHLRPQSGEARNGLGLALNKLGRVAEAIKQFEEAIRRQPDFVQAKINLGQVLAGQGRLAEAKALYLAALARDSNSVAAHINLGKLLTQEGRTAESILSYQQALRVDPAHPVAHFNLGNALAARNDPSAIAHYEAAIRADPDFVPARYNLGLSLIQQGRQLEGIAQLSEVVRLQPDAVEARLNLGVALAKQQRFRESIEQFQAALRLDPVNRTAARFLEQAQQQLDSP